MVIGRTLRGKEKLELMDSVKQAFGRRDSSVELARKHAMDRRKWILVLKG